MGRVRSRYTQTNTGVRGRAPKKMERRSCMVLLRGLGVENALALRKLKSGKKKRLKIREVVVLATLKGLDSEITPGYSSVLQGCEAYRGSALDCDLMREQGGASVKMNSKEE